MNPNLSAFIRGPLSALHLKARVVTHELGLKGPFQTLLYKAAKKHGWTLLPELSTHSSKRVVPDGTVRARLKS